MIEKIWYTTSKLKDLIFYRYFSFIYIFAYLRFRPLTLEQLVEKIESLAISDLPLDCLGYLLKHFPTPEEVTFL